MRLQPALPRCKSGRTLQGTHSTTVTITAAVYLRPISGSPDGPGWGLLNPRAGFDSLASCLSRPYRRNGRESPKLAARVRLPLGSFGYSLLDILSGSESGYSRACKASARRFESFHSHQTTAPGRDPSLRNSMRRFDSARWYCRSIDVVPRFRRSRRECLPEPPRSGNRRLFAFARLLAGRFGGLALVALFAFGAGFGLTRTATTRSSGQSVAGW